MPIRVLDLARKSISEWAKEELGGSQYIDTPEVGRIMPQARGDTDANFSYPQYMQIQTSWMLKLV